MHRFVPLPLLLAAVTLTAHAGERKYPKVDTAVGYEVDAAWPKKAEGTYWGAVSGVTVDAKDHVYIFTRADPPVQVYDTSGKLLRSWGKGIGMAHHIKVGPDGNIWISDIGLHVVEKYTPDGKLLQTIGTKGKAGRDQAHFNKPTDMAFGPDGNIYVSDGYGNDRVVYFDKAGKYLGEWGDLGSGPGQFSIPHAIAVDSKGRVFVADRNNARVQVFDGKGKFLEEWRNLVIPWGLHMTAKDELWVCGSTPTQWRKDDKNLGIPPKDQVCMKFTTDGRLLQVTNIPKGFDGLERPGEVNWVHAIALDSRGNIYLGDIIGKKAQKFTMKPPAK